MKSFGKNNYVCIGTMYVLVSSKVIIKVTTMYL